MDGGYYSNAHLHPDYGYIESQTHQHQQPAYHGELVRRGTKLTRPERAPSKRRTLRNQVAADRTSRFISPHMTPFGVGDEELRQPLESTEDGGRHPWRSFSQCITCCFPDAFLERNGKDEPGKKQAWREKMALMFIILSCCAVLGFFTYGLQKAICSPGQQRVGLFTPPSDAIAIRGLWYNADVLSSHPAGSRAAAQRFIQNVKDVTPFFIPQPSDECKSRGIPTPECKVDSFPSRCHSENSLSQASSKYLNMEVSLEWDDLERLSTQNIVVYNGIVLDVSEYLARASKDDNFAQSLSNHIYQDVTRLGTQSSDAKATMKCLVEQYKMGFLSKETPGCFAASVMNYIALTIILSYVFVRFAMALIFHCFLTRRLSETRPATYLPPGVSPPETKQTRRQSNAMQYASSSVTSRSIIPNRSRYSVYSSRSITPSESKPWLSSQTSLMAPQRLSTENYGTHVIMLVTCYNETEDGIRTTLESLARTDYDDRQKLFFIVCDGIVECGKDEAGKPIYTSDVCVNLIRKPTGYENEEVLPKSYVAVAEGAKQLNMAKVHAGYFMVDNRAVPAVVVVKCGTPEEATERKPGNRGKRDSQIVLMNFLSRVMFDDRLSALDYDLFTKIHRVTGVYADRYELVLMVDADTMVLPDSMVHLVNSMRNDTLIMGACGETRIANKNTNFVTLMQVYEYFISHHLAKAFESVFGGVTCLPGCFCIYRIKAPKGQDGFWAPILANPDVVAQYSQNNVDTLHRKNLLMLGEDRFLTTLMLQTFPKRKMMFIPKAICKTVVPDKFSVLFSQRRRWINSTVHNLMELVLVKDLCGTFCFSMQFVIALELLGTVTLPAAIFFTLVLIFSIATPQTSFVNESVLPLVMLLSILIVPSFLVLFTARNPVYFLYLIVYLIALPIWNFMLPLYAFWHFDDFGWGKTRAVAGDTSKDDGHGNSNGKFKSDLIQMRRWHEWERERCLKLAQNAMQPVRSPPRIQSANPSPRQSPPRGNSPTRYNNKSIVQDGYNGWDATLAPAIRTTTPNPNELLRPNAKMAPSPSPILPREMFLTPPPIHEQLPKSPADVVPTVTVSQPSSSGINDLPPPLPRKDEVTAENGAPQTHPLWEKEKELVPPPVPKNIRHSVVPEMDSLPPPPASIANTSAIPVIHEMDMTPQPNQKRGRDDM